MNIIQSPSPNFDERDRAIDMIVLHYTGMTSGQEALARLTSADAKVSAHYLVEENGDVFQLVEEQYRAWHAGVSSWQGDPQINSRSIGIEIVNSGHEFGYREFPLRQIESVIALMAGISSRHDIKPTLVLGHSDVAPARKEDPGEKFPWNELAKHGLAIGVYDGAPNVAISYDAALQALCDIGYEAAPGNHAAGLLAFQRRFCPSALGQGFNGLTKAALAWAVDQMTS